MSEPRRLFYVFLSVLAALLPGIAMSALLPHAPGGLALLTMLPGIAYLFVFGSAGKNKDDLEKPDRTEWNTWKYAGYVTLFAILWWGLLYGVAMLWS